MSERLPGCPPVLSWGGYLFPEQWFPKWTQSHGTLQVTKIRQQPVPLQTSMSHGCAVVTRFDSRQLCGDAETL